MNAGYLDKKIKIYIILEVLYGYLIQNFKEK